MSRTIFTILFALAASANAASSQIGGTTRPGLQARESIPRRHLSGPRFGFTVFTGETADMRDQANLEPLMTQFGWQWETQIRATQSGGQALMEWVLLVGGVEQDELNLSLGWITGYRLDNGVEFGVGPNLSYSKGSEKTTSSMVFAAGATLPFGNVQVPINFALSAAKGGPRIAALIGWIVG
jgi:hypothetical protein